MKKRVIKLSCIATGVLSGSRTGRFSHSVWMLLERVLFVFESWRRFFLIDLIIHL